MPKKPNPKFKDSDESKLREDTAETAYRSLQEAIGERPKTKPPSERTEVEKATEATKRGQKGGKEGGAKRAARMTDEERSRAATLAALARWKKSD